MTMQVKNGGALPFSRTGLEQAIEKLENFCRISENKEIRKLVTTTKHIVAVLTDAEKKQISSAVVRLSLLELKEVAFDAEDLIDELATDAAVQSMGAHTHNIATMAPSMLGRIHEMNDRLDRLEPQIAMLVFQISTLQDRYPGLATWRQTSSLLPDDKSVVGRDREKEHIIDMLTRVDESSSKDFSIVPIVGLGGMGKTTLSQLVFNDKEVKTHFELMMWVCVSHDFDRVRLTKNIIEAALAFKGIYKQCQLNNWDVVQRRLLQEVEGKTFLLVLDDVWETTWWEDLFKPLFSGKKESKVLVTARKMVFVDKLKRHLETPVLLGGLCDDDIWDLFKNYAFRENVHGDGTISAEFSHLEDLGRHIVQRLKGSPLAARTIGSLLNHDLSALHWKTVLKSEFWKLEQGENDILPVLQLSYEYLSTDLKQCFAYCSLFPKDHMFWKEEVVKLWEAQSFIREDGEARMETMGSKYFDELLHMSFFEYAPRSSDENIYVMHDLLHDLAEYVSKDDCFRLKDQTIVNIPDTVHHMSVYVCERGQIDTINKLCFHEKLRTLLFLTSCHLNTRDLDQLFLKLKMLRVLGLSKCGITELPDSIGDLKHLRYIDLESNVGLTKLPESLGNLYNLQVLNLKYCRSLDVLPSTMCQLVNLRHLQIDDCDLVSSVDGLGKLTGLQELTVRGRKVKELGGMCMLRELMVDNLEEVGSKEEASQARLHTMEHLQVLRLYWSADRDICTELEEEVLHALRPSDGIRELHIDGYGGIRSPDWMEASILTSFSSLRRVSLSNCPRWQVPPCSFLSQLRHLEYLEIECIGEWEAYWSCHVSWDCLLELAIINCPKLKELPTLPRTLRDLILVNVGISYLPELDGCSCVDRGIETSTSSLHLARTSASVLSRLVIFSCDNLTSISRLLQQQLPVLELIEIGDCKNLMSLPEKGFGHLVSLKRLLITNCPKLTCLLQEDEVGSSQHLPCSLEQLEISQCGDAMGGWWWAGLRRLTSIAELSLSGCPTTAELLFLSLGRHHHPHLPVALRELEIDGYNRFDHHQESTPLCTSSSSQLSPPITHAGASSAGAMIRAFTSLEKLTIRHSPNFLNKWGGDDGDDADQECLSACLPNLISLKNITLGNLENLHSLSNLSGVTSLKILHIKHCPSLQSLPDTLSCLSSLQDLVITDCHSIQSWPTNGLPSTLLTLTITRCHALTRRLKERDFNSLWPEVAHIPNVIIDGVQVKGGVRKWNWTTISLMGQCFSPLLISLLE